LRAVPDPRPVDTTLVPRDGAGGVPGRDVGRGGGGRGDRPRAGAGLRPVRVGTLHPPEAAGGRSPAPGRRPPAALPAVTQCRNKNSRVLTSAQRTSSHAFRLSFALATWPRAAFCSSSNGGRERAVRYNSSRIDSSLRGLVRSLPRRLFG